MKVAMWTLELGLSRQVVEVAPVDVKNPQKGHRRIRQFGSNRSDHSVLVSYLNTKKTKANEC
jgi:hypothetical protein